MKKLLLLGAYGFIGTNILKYIDDNLSDTYSVIVFDRSLIHPFGVTFNCVEKAYEGDFSDKTVIRRIFAENRFDYVIHSINTTVPSTSMNARFDIESNLLPTLDLLDIMVEYNTMDIIYFSSGGTIYGDMVDAPHKETDIEFPKSSYGVVKLAIEKYLFQYKEFYGINPLILRLSNPYGLYHYSSIQGIVNIGLRRAALNQSFEVWGNGEAKKDYIFISDFCFILFEMIRQNIKDGVFNIASNEILSVNQILTRIKDHFPGFSWSYAENKKNDISHFQLNTAKLQNRLGNLKFTPFSEGLSKTIEWLENSISG
jgi:UDP-glucose 4-epimerase